ncbi:MAG TPA: HypC/HybG/HupF family hydrogenase formation chaperone [Planctomycetota bacterium]|nr:HypC/HybG/HupF family hydrogenase formation chaperone [Planctomycetota bacterium]
MPGKISAIEGRNGTVDYGGGLTRKAALDLVPDAVVGDYVLVHAGYAITRIDQDEAEETLKLIREMGHPDAGG